MKIILLGFLIAGVSYYLGIKTGQAIEIQKQRIWFSHWSAKHKKTRV